MKRVLVIGCPGSGKSTFARALAARTDLSLCHLDLLFWNPDKTAVDREIFNARLSKVLEGERWILDGNFQSTLARRLSCADTVFFLDYPTELCLAGVASRRGKPRPDLPWIEEEDDEEFLSYIRAFAAERRPEILSLLAACEGCEGKDIHIFHTREEADRYLETLI